MPHATENYLRRELIAARARVRNLEVERDALLLALREFAACDLKPIVRFFNEHGEAAPGDIFCAHEKARAALAPRVTYPPPVIP